MTALDDLELTALAQLDGARVAIGAVLQGEWDPTPPLMDALAELVEVATASLAAVHELRSEMRCAA